MDTKEALKELSYPNFEYGGKCTPEVRQEAIKALEKCVPFKVKEEKWTHTKCKCGHIFSKHHGDGYHSIPVGNKTKYCPECGQKLEWKNK